VAASSTGTASNLIPVDFHLQLPFRMMAAVQALQWWPAEPSLHDPSGIAAESARTACPCRRAQGDCSVRSCGGNDGFAALSDFSWLTALAVSFLRLASVAHATLPKLQHDIANIAQLSATGI
jgi:hypothetical protein